MAEQGGTNLKLFLLFFYIKVYEIYYFIPFKYNNYRTWCLRKMFFQLSKNTRDTLTSQLSCKTLGHAVYTLNHKRIFSQYYMLQVTQCYIYIYIHSTLTHLLNIILLHSPDTAQCFPLPALPPSPISALVKRVQVIAVQSKQCMSWLLLCQIITPYHQ